MQRFLSNSCAAILLATILQAGAATYYVATNGSGLNDGLSPGNPWPFPHALSNVSAGDTLKLTNHYFREVGASTPESTRVSGSPGSPIIIDGQSMARIEFFKIQDPYYVFCNSLFTNEEPFNAYCLGLVEGAHYTVVSNCVFDMGDITNNVSAVYWQAYDVYPYDANDASHCQILDNEIVNGCNIAMDVVGHFNLIQSNYIHDLHGTEGIFHIFGMSNVIRANRIINSWDEAGWGSDDLLEITGSAGDPVRQTQGTIFERNLCSNLWVQSVSIVDYGNSNYLNDTVIRNNIFIRMDRFSQNNMRNVRLYNNTFYDCRPTNANAHVFGWTWSDSGVGYTNEYAHAGRCWNNVFLHCGTNVTTGGYYLFSTTGSGSELPLKGCWADYNFVARYSNGVPYHPVEADPEEVPVSDLAVWDNYEWYETNGINGGNPGFTDETNHVFTLKADSILIDAGISPAWEPSLATFTNDFYGNPRSGTPDIGAAEFQIPSTLVLHFTFADDYTNNGYVLDQSGNSHHGWLTDNSGTNEPGQVAGPSALGGYAWLGWSNGVTTSDITDHKQSQFLAITNLSGASERITNGSLAVWVQWATNAERVDTILDSGYPPLYAKTNETTTNTFSWHLGYYSAADGPSTTVTFRVFYEGCGDNNDTNGIIGLWPGQIMDGLTWVHLAATWSADSDSFVGYQNGEQIFSNAFVFPYIKMTDGDYAASDSQWLCVGAHQHIGRDIYPWWWESSDEQPNYGMFVGKLADLRVYNSTLTPAEIDELYVEMTNIVQRVVLRGRVVPRGRVVFQ